MSRLGPAKSERDRRECQILWTGSGNGQRLQRTSCQSRGGKARAALRACETPRGDGVEDDDDDEDGWETASSDEEAPTEAPP